MGRKKIRIKNIYYALFFFAGLSLGITLIWPGLIRNENRTCFFKIIGDGSDGKVNIGTILSIDPKSLVIINNAKTRYTKVLRIGDYCFRK